MKFPAAHIISIIDRKVGASNDGYRATAARRSETIEMLESAPRDVSDVDLSGNRADDCIRSVKKPKRGKPPLVIGLAFYSANGDATLERMLEAEARLRALGCDVDWVGDPLALAKRLVEGRRWHFLYAIGDGDLWSDRRWHVHALGDMYGQRIVDAGLTPIEHRRTIGMVTPALTPHTRRAPHVTNMDVGCARRQR